jgi:hypothetical protein
VPVIFIGVKLEVVIANKSGVRAVFEVEKEIDRVAKLVAALIADEVKKYRPSLATNLPPEKPE